MRFACGALGCEHARYRGVGKIERLRKNFPLASRRFCPRGDRGRVGTTHRAQVCSCRAAFPRCAWPPYRLLRRVMPRSMICGDAVMVPAAAGRHPGRGAAKHRAAPVAQPRPLVLEACHDPAHVRNFAGAQAKHVGHAGRLLVRGSAIVLAECAAGSAEHKREERRTARVDDDASSPAHIVRFAHFGPPFPRFAQLGHEF